MPNTDSVTLYCQLHGISRTAFASLAKVSPRAVLSYMDISSGKKTGNQHFGVMLQIQRALRITDPHDQLKANGFYKNTVSITGRNDRDITAAIKRLSQQKRVTLEDLAKAIRESSSKK